MKLKCKAALILLAGLIKVSTAGAVGAGDYYYVISENCKPVGLSDEQKDALTPDVLLFEIDPANISDYSVKINNDALSDYTEEGIAYLDNLQKKQIYTVGSHSDNNLKTEHRFLLQKEIINYQTLAGLLNRFSQVQNDKGRFYRKLLSIKNKAARFLAITEVRLTDEKIPDRVWLTHYRSAYYALDGSGQPVEPAVITVSHLASLTNWLHETPSQWQRTLQDGVCGEKPAYSHW